MIFLEPGSCRLRPRLLAAAVVATSLLASPRVFGWGFIEHTELGSKGYQAACDQLAGDLNLDVKPKPPQPGAPTGSSDPCLTPKNDATARWCLACRTFPPALYGQSIAIAGDHVGKPEDLISPRGQVVAASVVTYASLALENVQHFHPAAPRNWRTYHDRALELATKDYPGGPIARDFAEVFHTSAFADHFLQDAFSSGHAGFNRPATGAVASMAFHDIWNRAGRLVKSPTGSCWVQYGDGKLKFASETARFQIDAAQKAAVYDVLAAFITGKRDPGRETRPVLYMPSEITPNPLPGPVWGTRGDAPHPKGEETKIRVVGVAQTAKGPAPDELPVINDIYWQQKHSLQAGCVEEMVPIDGISNPALINGGVDFWASGAGDREMWSGGIDVLYNHRLFSLMSLPVSWEGGIGFSYLRRDGRDGAAPGATLGLLAPPLYLLHGLWRNEIGVQAKGYYFITSGPNQFDGSLNPILRSSIEAATVIVRLQAGPTIDFRTGRLGVAAALGFQFSGTRWITGGGSMTDF
jgi:hypothetical protein